MFEKLLEEDGSLTVYQYAICIEFYKVYNHNLSQTIFSDLFTRNINSYNLGLKPDFVIPQVRTVSKESS